MVGVGPGREQFVQFTDPSGTYDQNGEADDDGYWGAEDSGDVGPGILVI